jgi:hypothetical protein
MAESEVRTEERTLLQTVQLGVREPVLVALCKLLEIRLLKYQSRMLDCQPDEFVALQAEAKAVAKLIREIKGKPN